MAPVNTPASARVEPEASLWETSQEVDSATRNRQSVNGLFRVFLPLGGARRVLTDANGIGATALSLAALADHVICLCPNHATATLVTHRARRDGIANVHPVVATLAAVPCRSSSVNHVSLHRVEPPATPPPARGAAAALAAEITRVLGDGASLFVSFERRRAHLGPVRRTPRHLRATVREFRRRLQVRASVFHYPSLDDISLVEYVDRRRRRRGDRWLAFRRWVAGTNAGVILEKPPAGSATAIVLQQVCARVAELTRTTATMPRSVFFGTGGSLVADLGSMIVRLPQHDAAAGRCAANLAALRRLAAGRGLAHAPRPIGEGAIYGQRFFAESRVNGVSMDEAAVAPSIREAIREQAVTLLMDKPAMYVAPASRDTIRALVDREFAGVTPFVPRDARHVLERMAARMCGILDERQVPLVVHHGDFKCANFLYATSPHLRLTGVVDWDLASIPGLPLLDLLTLHFDMPGTSVADLPRSFHALAGTDDVPPVVRRYAIHWGLSAPVVRQLALFTTVKHLNRHFHYSQRARPLWQQLLRATLLAGD